MSAVLCITDPSLLKSHVKGYTKHDGTVVNDYETKAPKVWKVDKVIAKHPELPPAVALPHVPVHKQASLFGSSAAVAMTHAAEMQHVTAPQYGMGKTPFLYFGEKPLGKPKAYHPRAGVDGEKVGIYHPSTSALEGFEDPSATVTVCPGDPVPAELNGIAMAPWVPPDTWEGWADVDGQVPLDEPPVVLTGKKQEATGVVIVEPDGRAWVVSPTNGFGGYKRTLPKGKNDEELPLQANAIKEAFEESGLKVSIIGMLGDVERTTSVTRYYLAHRTGGSPTDMGWESQAVSLTPISGLHEFLDSKNDHAVVDLLSAHGGES